MRQCLLTFLAVMIASLFSAITCAQTSREDLLRELDSKRSELQKLEEQFLSPSDDDRAAFAEFLKQPDTGLIRLLPRETYDEIGPNKPGKLTVRGGGAYYSFSRLTHEYGYGSDIELSNGYLSVGFAGADYGFMTTIDVPLEEISINHPAVSSLVKYRPPLEESVARLEGRSFWPKGRAIGDNTYQRRLPVQLNTSYLLRSINYGDSDVLVVFRPIRKDTDGSLIIAWKLLKKYSKPELIKTSISN
jgi:hypothetical protein